MFVAVRNLIENHLRYLSVHCIVQNLQSDERKNAGSVNIKAMKVHAMSFGLYMFRLVCSLAIYGFVSETNGLNMYAWTFNDICAFASQIILSMILWDLAK
jgi:hypothetical protein